MQQTRNLTCKPSSHRWCFVKMFSFFGCWERGLLREVVAAAETADLAQLLFDSARSNLPQQHWRTEKTAQWAVSRNGGAFFLPFGASQICHETNHWNQRGTTNQATKRTPFYTCNISCFQPHSNPLHLHLLRVVPTSFRYRVSQQVLVKNSSNRMLTNFHDFFRIL